MNILVTGGAGYIGSHTVIALLESGHRVAVVDNLSNSCEKSLERVQEITGENIPFYPVDIRDGDGLRKAIKSFGEETGQKFDCCIHFAGLKSPNESIRLPLNYYDNNINGTLVLLDVLREHGCKNLIFSSSASVYGDPAVIPVTEECPKGQCTNPYGWTKSMLEQILTDMHTSDPEYNIVLLRYFNPLGAHRSGLIGEDPNGIPNNLMPYITQVAVGRRDELSVYGDDYDTPDGTGIRDYIHVVDLACGHVKALQAIERKCGVAVYNLGTGRGYSVLEVVRAFEEANGVKVPYVIKPRRAGDVAVSYSDPAKAERELGFKAKFDIVDMCRDAWNWQRKNPDGLKCEKN